MLVKRNLTFKKIFPLIVILLVVLAIPSCIIVKEKALPPKTAQKIEMSKLRAEATQLLSNDVIITPDSEIVTFKPKDWFFIDISDLKNNVSNGEIVAIAVNKDYTMAFIVSKVIQSLAMTKLLEDEDMADVARLHFQQKKESATEQLFMASDYELIPYGLKEIPLYSFTSLGNTQKVRVALLKTTTKKLYELALVPLEISSATPFTEKESLLLFQTILATTLF